MKKYFKHVKCKSCNKIKRFCSCSEICKDCGLVKELCGCNPVPDVVKWHKKKNIINILKILHIKY